MNRKPRTSLLSLALAAVMLLGVIPMVATFGAAGLFVGIVGSWTSIRKFMNV